MKGRGGGIYLEEQGAVAEGHGGEEIRLGEVVGVQGPEGIEFGLEGAEAR